MVEADRRLKRDVLYVRFGSKADFSLEQPNLISSYRNGLRQLTGHEREDEVLRRMLNTEPAPLNKQAKRRMP